MKLIERTTYLSRLQNLRGTPDIKVITGIRRSGKSKLMESFIRKIQTESPNANIIHINFSLIQTEHLREYHALLYYIHTQTKENTDNIVCIDEVQTCEGFEIAIISLHAEDKYDIYITGSNAFLLSNDLATLFTGRTFEIEVYPFSLNEFMQYFELQDKNRALKRYIEEGGMAGSYIYENLQDKYSYISEIFDTLIVRDVFQRYSLKNTVVLDKLTDFLLDNSSNQTSGRKISEYLNSAGMKISHVTINEYLKYLTEAFAFYRIRRYDIAGKRYFSTQEKYYAADHSFRYAKLGTKNANLGRVLENIVAIELLRRGYEVYAGELYHKEVDFVALKRNEKYYIQVSQNLDNSETLQRELAPLQAIKDAYPKMILACTGVEEYDIEGIHICNLADWLTQSG